MKIDDLFDQRVKDLGDWRGELVVKLRQLVKESDHGIEEDWKWDTLVFSHSGLVCAVGAFKDNAGLNFFKGASLKDPHKLFNAGLEAKTSRSVRFFEGDKVDEPALKELIKEAVEYNLKK